MDSPEPVVRHIAFEALFIHGLQVDEAALRKAGFDLKKQEAQYPLSVLGRCLDAAIAQHFQGVPSRDAYRIMGNTFIKGILSTMLGKVVGVAILLSGADRTTKRIPSLLKSDYGVTVEAAQVAPRHYTVTSAFGYAQWVGQFIHGIYEEALRRTNVVPDSSCRFDANTGSFVLELKWPEKSA